MKQRIRVVVVENEKLRSELKAEAVDESLKDYTIRNSTVICACVKIIGLIFVCENGNACNNEGTYSTNIIMRGIKKTEVTLWLSHT